MTASNDLNNYLQGRHQSSLLTWVELSSGPSHDQTWTVYCKVDGNVLGTGVASTKQAAKDLAARQALQVLQSS